VSFEDAGIHFGLGFIPLHWNRIVAVQNSVEVFIAEFYGEKGNPAGWSLTQPTECWLKWFLFGTYVLKIIKIIFSTI
jgi:hypothetical protein